MSDVIAFTVPQTITSCFVVAADRLPGDLASVAKNRLSEPYATPALERFGTPRLRVAGRPAGESPWDLGGVSAVNDEDLPYEEQMKRAAYHIAVATTVAVPDQPLGTQVARAVARTIASATGGVAVDLMTDAIVHLPEPKSHVLSPVAVERARFVLADDWLSPICPPTVVGGLCPAAGSGRGPARCACTRLTTAGLCRFGLPELHIDRVACTYDLAALNLLRTVAQRLLTEQWARVAMQPGGGAHAIDPDLTLADDDFARYWGTEDPVSTENLRVGLTASRPGLITVGPPRGFGGTVNDWLGDRVPEALHETLSISAHDDPAHIVVHQR